MLHLVRAVILTGYVETAFYVGLDPYEMMRRHQLSPAMLEDTENRVSADLVVALLDDSARQSGCPHFGLLMAECRTFSSLGPVALLLEHLGSIYEIREAVRQYRRHLNDILVLGEAKRDDEFLQIELLAPYASAQACALTVAVGYIVLTGASRGQWQPSAVHLTHSEPEDSSYYRKFFAMPLIFGSEFNGFESPRELMHERWPWANDTMARHAHRLLKLVDINPESLPFTDSVNRSITLLLPRGRATLPNVAANLGASSRALQRHLEREGSAFGQLLNDIRRELVLRYLANPGHSITSIAELLGYSTSSSFTRWFTTEFGVSPRAWRLRQSKRIERLAA